MRIAAIDQGTTSTRCLVVDASGQCVLTGTRRHARYHPHASWVEHDPEELLHNVAALLATAGQVDAIAICNQGESCLAWDARTGRPLSPVIVWQDARTATALAQMGEAAELCSKRISGLPLDPYFSASKLAWMIRNIPAVAAALEQGRLRLGTTDAFFLDRLCGTFATDLATASRTGLLDLATGQWSEALCALYGVPRQCLPEIRAVDAGFGDINGTPVKVSIVDQQAALYGHHCQQRGDCKITFGTGAFFLAIAGTERPHPVDLLPTIAWKRQDDAVTYAIEGGVYDAGSALEWARRIGLYSALEELNQFEGPSAISRGIVFVPALSGLAAPYWDRHAASLFIGMDHAADRRDMVRAVLEGIAMLTAKLIETADKTLPLDDRISIDGGLSQSAYFARFLASACQKRICVSSMYELSALGLARLCGLDVSQMRGAMTTYAPSDFVSAQDHAVFAAAIARASSWRAAAAL
ncbi:FGGY family carbohydrate kinase [Aquitalea sp. LB_tupeE]|uniref:FGGY family carbohydrate kinase n=1 Tax=Aquitalea sp. LB_tupeE TaxID=2748078 RepID=UPI0015BD7E5C|nr:FGGY family carbohydrate kinase [Aquitalea sp. LB_tupeE]NWK78189.1 glycerol kinase [Aquitalea sp. LB_tupeE]